MSISLKGPLLRSSSSPKASSISAWLSRLEPLSRRLFWRALYNRLSESPIFWLGMYFVSNLALTLYNKSVLIEFPFPYTLTALHALCSTAGAVILLRSETVTSVDAKATTISLNSQEITSLISFSVLYTINIAVSNISLDLVTVPFHQVVRATTPAFIVVLSRLLFGSKSSRNKLLALIPVVAGVSVATYGDYSFTWWGFSLTMLGTVLSAMKTIFTNVLQTTTTRDNTKYTRSCLTPFLHFLEPRPTLSTLSPVELLRLLSPLAFVQSLILAYFTGELGQVYHYANHHFNYRQRALLVIDGLLAFGLNVASFGTNKRVGALTMTVAGNVKQVLTMLLAVVVFNVQITSTHALGIVVTLLGGAYYTNVEMQEKKHAKHMRESSLPSMASLGNTRPDFSEKLYETQGVQR